MSISRDQARIIAQNVPDGEHLSPRLIKEIASQQGIKITTIQAQATLPSVRAFRAWVKRDSNRMNATKYNFNRTLKRRVDFIDSETGENYGQQVVNVTTQTVVTLK